MACGIHNNTLVYHFPIDSKSALLKTFWSRPKRANATGFGVKVAESIKTMLQNHVCVHHDVEHKTTSGCDAGVARYKHTHNIVHMYIKHTLVGVFIIICLVGGRRIYSQLSAGGCAAARASERAPRGEDQTGVGGWVQEAKLVVPRCTGEARVITTLSQHTALYWRPIDFISSGRFQTTTFAPDYPAAAWPCRKDAHRQNQIAIHGRVLIALARNALANVTFCAFWWNCACWWAGTLELWIWWLLIVSHPA